MGMLLQSTDWTTVEERTGEGGHLAANQRKEAPVGE